MIITYRGIDRSAAMEARVRDLAAQLDDVYDGIARCDVVVETLARSESLGGKYRVRLAIAVPGGEIVVSPDPEADLEDEDPTSAVRDSFQAARRRLEQYVWRNLRDDPGPPEWPARSG